MGQNDPILESLWLFTWSLLEYIRFIHNSAIPGSISTVFPSFSLFLKVVTSHIAFFFRLHNLESILQHLTVSVSASTIVELSISASV
jgi:hypothetical protein